MISNDEKRELGIRINPISTFWAKERHQVRENFIELRSTPVGELGLIHIFNTEESTQIIEIIENVELENKKVIFEDDSIDGKYALVTYLAKVQVQ